MDYLRAAAQRGPIFILLEDCQWLDPLSFDLLEEVARAMVNLPIFLVLAYRPMELERVLTGILFQFEYFTPITLEALTEDQVEDLIWLKLGQGADRNREVPRELVKRITDQAEGNPFYTEELLNYLSYHGIDPFDVQAVAHLELPSSLHSLVLSRIDQLTESQKITLKVASVVGRVFQAAWLWGVYPELGDPTEVCNDLEAITRQDLTSAESAEPELAYFSSRS
ncbi:MAG: hypothetical protein HC802_13345 [Caldilineaceae bacterium]|nr:hypothetical protein [Caldilineaceae bacterium]